MRNRPANRIGRIVRSIYRVPAYRFLYTQARLRLRTLGRRIAGPTRHGSNPVTIAHNLKSMHSFNTRNEKLLLASLCVEDIESARTLIVGCRTEEEIFLFRGYGFSDITAVDLISYSPLVVEADMHRLPYADNSFDFIFCAYTLSYSEHPSKAADELARVTRDGGTVAIAIEYCPWDQRREIEQSLAGYTIIPDQKLESADDILGLFGDRVGSVFVRYDAERKRHHKVDGMVERPSPVMVVFSIAKDR